MSICTGIARANIVIMWAALLGHMLRGDATSSLCFVCGDMSCVEIEWVGRCHWLELFAGGLLASGEAYAMQDIGISATKGDDATDTLIE